ncbi:hypothetical protein RRG08_023735 [Elysia crispata]|uniref:Uncharacterized protein n=1 Tax=Elysia crispata TaxID=231223 RepID=A0AAE0ZXE7_9GAST|nr:hypothetical protein RRG08_023735 [Elysia crispata]
MKIPRHWQRTHLPCNVFSLTKSISPALYLLFSVDGCFILASTHSSSLSVTPPPPRYQLLVLCHRFTDTSIKSCSSPLYTSRSGRGRIDVSSGS